MASLVGACGRAGGPEKQRAARGAARSHVESENYYTKIAKIKTQRKLLHRCFNITRKTELCSNLGLGIRVEG